MTTPDRQRGFVLVLVLVLVLIAATLLTATARKSFTQAILVDQAECELQRRWAELTCQSTFLGKIKGILNDAEIEVERPIATLGISCPLGPRDENSSDTPGHRHPLTMKILFTDEQAKVNVNTLLKNSSDRQVATLSVQRLIRGDRAGVDYIPIRLQPYIISGNNTVQDNNDQPREAHASTARATLILPDSVAGDNATSNESNTVAPVNTALMMSYDQVFDDVSPSLLFAPDITDCAVTDITCWGNGALNFYRASDRAVSHVLTPMIGLGNVSRLLECRQDNPNANVKTAVAQMTALSDTQKTVLTRALADKSSCHGLWVIFTTPQRTWYHLAIDDKAQHGVPRNLRFEW